MAKKSYPLEELINTMKEFECEIEDNLEELLQKVIAKVYQLNQKMKHIYLGTSLQNEFKNVGLGALI